MTEQRAWRNFKQRGDLAAKDWLMQHHHKLMLSVVSKHKRELTNMEEGDLVAVAMMGLSLACDRFDPSRELAFSTFAVRTIRGYLLHAILDARPGPRYVHDVRKNIAKAEAAMRTAQEEITETTLAKRAGCTVETLRVIRLMPRALPLWSSRFSDAQMAENLILEQMADPNAVSPEEAALEQERADMLDAALDQLKPRSAYVMRRLFGDEAQLQPIADELGTTRQAVWNARNGAMKSLRRILRGNALLDPQHKNIGSKRNSKKCDKAETTGAHIPDAQERIFLDRVAALHQDIIDSLAAD